MQGLESWDRIQGTDDPSVAFCRPASMDSLNDGEVQLVTAVDRRKEVISDSGDHQVPEKIHDILSDFEREATHNFSDSSRRVESSLVEGISDDFFRGLDIHAATPAHEVHVRDDQLGLQWTGRERRKGIHLKSRKRYTRSLSPKPRTRITNISIRKAHKRTTSQSAVRPIEKY
eukprot:CAMPEP_0182444352 /NCGR_PEP_ID=MMETSP1172-20130603/2828_1 /TAXON_ID=708627 /ORGANISM="Timspurckia oligopyrenoides, Strain CCMP3278" /LENGTH=172 /DNA_ID=CAMNT_0024639889 /DNA_START=284 /DNA_END=802 /DNA_ORIENTATION=+